MKITLTTDDGKEPATLPYDGAAFVNVESKCPTCGQQSVRGTGNSIENHDTYRSDAVCTKCGATRGVLRVKVSTIFGIEEDERVLNGRCRVY